jgi:hypothetical protein
MEIQRVGDISHKEFMKEFYEPAIPVVFKNASKVWKAKELFNPDWFRSNYGDRITEKDNTEYTMKEIMDLVEKSTESQPAPYPFIFNIPTTIPELLPLLEPLNLNYATPNWLETNWFKKGSWGSATELFIGGPGGKFPYLHLDYYHLNAWINQLYGEKRFTVFPAGQEDLLYPKAGDPWRSDVNIFEPDYNKFPKFKDATPVEFTVGPGETLFIPAGTWHSAYSLTPTISVAFDQLNSKNFPDFMKDVWVFNRKASRKRAVAMYTYALLGGQVCKLKSALGS